MAISDAALVSAHCGFAYKGCSKALLASDGRQIKAPMLKHVDKELDLVCLGLEASATAEANKHHESGVFICHTRFYEGLPILILIKVGTSLRA